MTYWSAILLGIIQGLAGFLPISSSGHLAILQNFLRIGDLENQMLFDVLLHLGTLGAVILAYHMELRGLCREGLAMLHIKKLRRGVKPDLPRRRLLLFLIAATLPLIPAGLFIVSINTGAYMAEIVRGGIISVDKGQLEGAYSVGMTHAQAMVKVVIPQVLQNILPSISNEFVINIKDTSVLNVIGVTELYYMAGVIKRINLQTFQVYTVICVLYFILTFTVTRLLRLAEKKLAGSDSYTICGSGSDSQAEIHIREAQ